MNSKPILLLIVASLAGTACAQFYSIGNLASGQISAGYTGVTVAGNGQVFGTSRLYIPGQSYVDLGQSAFVWDPSNGIQRMGSLGPGFGSRDQTVPTAYDNGRTYGYSDLYTSSRQPQGPRAFVWDSASGMRSLGTLGTDNNGQGYSRAWDAEGSRAVGESTLYVNGEGKGSRAFVWDETNGIRSIGSLGTDAAGNGRATALAIDGGRAFGISDFYENGQYKGQYVFVWDEAQGMRSLGTLGVNASGISISTFTYADGGRAYGNSPLHENGQYKGTRGFVWDDANGMRSVGTLGTSSTGSGSSTVNFASEGRAYGSSGLFEGGSYVGDRAFVWDEENGIRSLGTLGTNASGFGSSNVYAVDGDNVFGVANRYEGGTLLGQRAFVWTASQGMRDLNDVLAGVVPTGWILNDVTLAKDGWIYGNATTATGGEAYAYRYTPVPEPATLATLGLGALAVLRRRQRR